MRTVVGMYDHFEDAQQAVQALRQDGFSPDDISMIARDPNGEYTRYLEGNREGKQENIADGTAKGAGVGAVLGGLGGLLVGLGALAIPGIGPVIAAGPIATTLLGAGAGAVAGGIVGALADLGVPKQNAEEYAEGVRRGGTLVVVRSDDDMAEQAASIMNRFNPVDVHGRAASWRQNKWTGFDQNAAEMTSDEMASQPVYEEQDENIPVTGDTTDEMTIPVVEEDVRVGKRQVDTGGVRIHSYTTEQPVEQDVNLRQEHVNVERRPVDRPASDEDFNTFQEGTMELKETAEEPVVEKRARVVEEVHVNKDVEETNQTIRDTVRRKDVEVEPLNQQDWARYEQGFRQDFQTRYGSGGQNFNYYLPAYRYGYDLANDPQYSDMSWDEIEPQARAAWQSRGGQGAWNDVKDAVRFAWDRATNNM